MKRTNKLLALLTCLAVIASALSVFATGSFAQDEVISLGKPAVVYTTPARTNTTDYELKSAPGVTDGKTSDVWVYGAFGTMYAQIDLETEFDVSSVNVKTYYNAAYGGLNHAWSVYLSTDGETFVKAGAVEKTPHPEEGIALTFTPVKARYVRVVADFYVTSEQFSFKEVTVYGSLPAVPLYPYTGEMTATLPDGTTTDVLTDGVYDEYLNVSGADGGSVTIDLKESVPVDTVAVYAYENNSAYAVYASVDGETWTTIGYKDLNAAANTANGWEYILPASGSYRYVRVQWAVGRSSPADGYVTIKEIDISFEGTEYTDVTVTNVKCVYNNKNANDGNYSNYNFLYKANGALVLDLGQVKDVRRAAVFTKSGDYGVRAEYSEDGSTYSDMGVLLPDDRYDPAQGLVFTVPYSSARYLRFTCVGSASGTLDLSEIVVYTPDEPVAEDPEGLADAVVLSGGEYTVPEYNEKGEPVTVLCGSAPALTGTVDVLTVPARVTGLDGAFSGLQIGKLLLKDPGFASEEVLEQALAASGEVFTYNPALEALGARNMLEVKSAKAENGTVTAVAALSVNDLDYNGLSLQMTFTQNGTQVKSFSREIRKVYRTLTGYASVDEGTALAQQIDCFGEDAFLFGVSVTGVPAGSYEVTLQVEGAVDDAAGESVSVSSAAVTFSVTVG